MSDRNQAIQGELLEFATEEPPRPGAPSHGSVGGLLAGDRTTRSDTAAHIQEGAEGPRLDAAIAQPEPSTLNVFVTLEDLLAPTDWGDALRIANARFDDICLAIDQEHRSTLLLWNPSTGMWRLQGDHRFKALFDRVLDEANATALRLAEQDPTVEDRMVRRLRRHIDRTSAGSVSRAVKRSARLADDPCVPIMRVNWEHLNPVGEHPMLACENGLFRLTDGERVSPQDVKGFRLLDVTPCPTAFVPEAHEREGPGAVAMRRFLRYLGAGDEQVLTRRLGWQLCGRHDAIDVIAGDETALYLLARALQDTLGPGGARLLSMDRGDVRTRDAAYAMEQARLCLWPGADHCKTFPVWELNDLTCRYEARRQGNLMLLVSEWPEGVESLDHRMASKYAWALRTDENLRQRDIDPAVLLAQDGRECLLAMLVEGASRSHHEFEATQSITGLGDPSQVAVTDYTRACAEKLRLAGAHPIHRTLYRAVRFTDDPGDVMTLANVDDAIGAVGEPALSHHVIGKAILRMWPAVESGRDRIDGVQTRVLRRVAPRTDHPDNAW